MDEIELAIAMDFLDRAKAYMEDSNAQVMNSRFVDTTCTSLQNA